MKSLSLPRWIMPYPFAWVSTSLYLGVLILFFYYESLGGCTCAASGWRGAAMVGLVVALLVLERIEHRLPPSAAFGLLVLKVVFIELIAQLDNFNFSPFIYLFLPYVGWMSLGSRGGYGIALLAWVRFFLQMQSYDRFWYTDELIVNYLLTFSVGLIFTLMMARTIAQEKINRQRAETLLEDLELAHIQLQLYAQQVSELAAAEERNHLARDIHDSLGHYLTVINVQLEKALVFRQKKPLEADQAVIDAKRLAREALQDVRQSVSTLRNSQETFSLVDLLKKLVTNVNSSLLKVELHIIGDEHLFSKQILIALYRAAQEGLTNVQKHANARQVVIDLRFDQTEVCLSITDDGRGFDPAKPPREGSYGLIGIRERLSFVGGELKIEPQQPHGTGLIMTVPKSMNTLELDDERK